MAHVIVRPARYIDDLDVRPACDGLGPADDDRETLRVVWTDAPS